MTARFTIKSEVDFIALAPVALGFMPTHSLVMMTLNSFHARVDIPTSTEDIFEVVHTLLSGCLKNGVKQVAFVVFDEGDHEELGQELLDTFIGSGVDVVAAVDVGEGKYRRFGAAWQDFDMASHPLLLEAQFMGVAPKHGTREDMVQSIKPVGAGWSTTVTVALEVLRENGVDGVVNNLTRANARDAVGLWSEAIRGCEEGAPLVEEVAQVLAVAAWLAGDGALAWSALDLADKDAEWHGLITHVLNNAVSPETWPGG